MTGPSVLTREQAIHELRQYLVGLTGEQSSICEVAARNQIFCRGFARWDDDELKRRYRFLVERRPGLTRAKLEEVANTWQLARQIVEGVSIACDAEAIQHHVCRGWDEFSNEELARFCAELLGVNAVVVDARPSLRI